MLFFRRSMSNEDIEIVILIIVRKIIFKNDTFFIKLNLNNLLIIYNLLINSG